jgi:hypothetical protein
MVVWALATQSESYAQDMVERVFDKKQLSHPVIQKIGHILSQRKFDDATLIWERMVNHKFLRDRLRENPGKSLTVRMTRDVHDADFKIRNVDLKSISCAFSHFF